MKLSSIPAWAELGPVQPQINSKLSSLCNVTIPVKKTLALDQDFPPGSPNSLTYLFNHYQTPYMMDQLILYLSLVMCAWSLHKHAHGVLMSICAHESFMSMLMKLSCARARGGVTRTTTLGQYASRRVLWALVEFHNDQKNVPECLEGLEIVKCTNSIQRLDFSRKSWGPY